MIRVREFSYKFISNLAYVHLVQIFIVKYMLIIKTTVKYVLVTETSVRSSTICN